MIVGNAIEIFINFEKNKERSQQIHDRALTPEDVKKEMKILNKRASTFFKSI
jgi:hypothetical protein